MNSGKFVRALRCYLESESITQKEFAEKVGVSAQSVSRWMTGENHPQGKTLAKIEEFLGDWQLSLEVNDLLDYWSPYLPDANYFVELPPLISDYLRKLPPAELARLSTALCGRWRYRLPEEMQSDAPDAPVVEDALAGKISQVPVEFVKEICQMHDDIDIYDAFGVKGSLSPVISSAELVANYDVHTALHDFAKANATSHIESGDAAFTGVRLGKDVTVCDRIAVDDIVFVSEVYDLEVDRAYFFIWKDRAYCLYYAGTVDGGEKMIFSAGSDGSASYIVNEPTLLCRVHSASRSF